KPHVGVELESLRGTLNRASAQREQERCGDQDSAEVPKGVFHKYCPLLCNRSSSLPCAIRGCRASELSNLRTAGFGCNKWPWRVCPFGLTEAVSRSLPSAQVESAGNFRRRWFWPKIRDL